MSMTLNPPHTDDTSRVLAAIDRLEADEIDHGTARTIASWYTEGSDSVSMTFTSTGAITGDVWGHLTDDGTLYIALPDDHGDKLALDYLGTYLVNRMVNNDTGPIEGWSSMWVPDIEDD